MTFVYFVEKKSNKKYEIFKRLTTIGSSPSADIKISNQNAPSVAAYINKTEENWTLIVPEDKNPALVNGFFTRKQTLQDASSIVICDTEFLFTSSNIQQNVAENDEASVLMAHKKLLEFSQKIAKEKNIDNLLNILLDEIIDLTNAEYGFLVLLENNKAKIHAQRNINEKEMSGLNPISDSILNKVVKTKEPLVISNALDDKEFSSSMSVINYRLTSVMCVPLCYQNEVFGAIYVGNNSFTNVFNEKSLAIMMIYSSQAALLVQNALYIDALEKNANKLKETLDNFKFGSMIGACENMQEVFSKIEKISKTDVSVLIMGEKGTGKDLVAKEIHERSERAAYSFCVINCDFAHEEMLESELFGHVRGAFDGATHTKMGKIQLTNNGTILLDEINYLSLNLQIKLYNALKLKKISKIGDNKFEDFNVRILSTTSVDLESMVKKGLFREDLYYLISNIAIKIPPLRERGNDIFVMANFFLQKYAQVYEKNITGFNEEAQIALLNYNWPGNVRELENSIKRAVVLCEERKICVQDMNITSQQVEVPIRLNDAIEQFKIKYINDSLERNLGNRTKTAKELGVDPRTIFRHLENQKRDDV